MSQGEILKATKEKMEKTISAVKRDFSTIRTGRASASILDNIKVEYYGTELPLNQVATISTPEAQLIIVQPWDKNALRPITTAINKSDLGLAPNSDGEVIRLNIPALTQERRKELDKAVKKKAEDGRVAIRNVRREANHTLDQLEKEKDLSEDQAKKAKDKIQELTDEFIKRIDEILAHKEKEILE